MYLRAHSRLRNSLIWLGGVALVLSLLLIALPFAVARFAESWLRDNGALDARIDNIDINLFTGVVRISGLHAGGAANARLSVGTAEINVRWWPLVSRRAYVEGLRLDDIELDVVAQETGGWRIGALSIVPAAADAVDTAEDSDAAFAWGIGSEIVDLTNIQVTYKDAVFDTRIDINEIRLGSQFSWEASRTAEFVVDLAVNGAPLVLRSDVAPWDDRRRFSGALALQQFDLAEHGQALQSFAGVEDVSGTAEIDIRIDAALAGNGELTVNISGPIGLSNVGFTLDTLTVTNQALDWSGDVALRFPATADTPLLRVDGAISLGGSQLEQGALNFANESVNWQGQIELVSAADGEMNLQVDGELAVAGTDITQEAIQLTNQSLTWQGGINLVVPGNGDASRLYMDGALQLVNTGVKLVDLALDFALADLGWTGVIDFTGAAVDGVPALAVQSALTAQGLQLSHSELPYDLVTIATVAVEGLNLSAVDQAAITRLTLQDVQLLGERVGTAQTGRPTLSLQELAIADLGFAAAGGLAIDSITFSEPRVSLVRNAQGEFARITETLAVFASEEDSEATDDAAATMPVTIVSLQIRGANFFSFQDLSVTPPVSFALTTTDLVINTIDTSGNQPMTLQLATGNGTMSLAVEGSADAFADTLQVDLTVNLSALDLPQFSPYVPGYNIDRGRLGTETTVVINGDALDVRNNLAVDRLTLSSKAGGNDILSRGLAMPLDVALDLLRDGDDRIALRIPVTGSVSDPQFGTGDVVRVAMQRALQNAAMSYITNALQPLGAILLVRDLAQQASRPRFVPIDMTPGDSALSDTGREYLQKISEMLNDRPALQLTLCGVATSTDRDAMVQALVAAQLAAQPDAQAATPVAAATPEPVNIIAALTGAAATGASQVENPIGDATQTPLPEVSDQALLQLAAMRTAAATSFLANDNGIARERLFSCRETIERDSAEGPRVDITL